MIPCQSVRFPDFCGRMFTLAANADHYRQTAANGENILLLGAGPDAEELDFVKGGLARGANIYLLHSPKFEALARKPENAKRFEFKLIEEVDAAKARKLAKNSSVFFYKPAMRVEPDFWGPFLGKVEADLAQISHKKPGKTACLPGNDGQLVHIEMRQALVEAGFETITQDFAAEPGKFIKSGIRPDIFVSINFRGLDPEGRIFHFLRAQNIPVAIWMVDNPWHLLSALRLPWWKDASIFVTDASFIPALRAEGAKDAHFLPLAASSHMLKDGYDGGGPPVFVGRSEFPDKKSYFAAASVPANLLAGSRTLFKLKMLPDFHWWQARLGDRLWPGFAGRNAGLGAENCSRFNRQRWLLAGKEAGMEIYGDEGWQKLVPGATLHGPVDYYGKLPQIYAHALAVLNVTSLLLPQSLSQRHFDVWAASGFLLSDATTGLEIFSSDLVGEIRLGQPEDLPEKLAWLVEHPKRRRELSAAWREEIIARHLYGDRLTAILRILETAP